MKRQQKSCLFILVLILSCSQVFAGAANTSNQTTMAATARSYVLMEQSSGKVLLEHNSDVAYPPASITKVMTLLLINEAIRDGKINWDDKVSVSEHAAHMGGSQVFMEPGEEQTVRDLVKCICIASANDAAVAMSEYIAGSEEQFVNLMNKRAAELGMEHTVFKNACGLHVEGHVSTAKDIALMSRALLSEFPEMSKTLTTWMDSITHRTRRGETEFGLSNTNKMIKWYSGITGLKTGYTPQAKHCVSATATRDHMNLIAVIMGAADGKTRFKEAAQLLDYGFATYGVKLGPEVGSVVEKVPIKKGNVDELEVAVSETKSFVVPKESIKSELTYQTTYKEKLTAPINQGEEVGKIVYYLDGNEVGEGTLLAASSVKKATLKQMIPYIGKRFFKVSK